MVTPQMTGVDYERAVARSLGACGWRAETTKASGDQGLDVLATRGHHSVAIQCKRYSKPVGNGAVQEAYAAKGIHGATHAAVVTNTQFTRSAIAAAEKLGVLLLHHDDLPRLRSLLSLAHRPIATPHTGGHPASPKPTAKRLTGPASAPAPAPAQNEPRKQGPDLLIFAKKTA